MTTDPNLDIMDIMKRLPHRYPFLLVDRVTTFVRGESLEAYKNVTFNEEFFQGHFPGRPVMPGVLIMEAMGQAGGILAFLSMEDENADGAVIYFMGMDKVKFRRPVVPGDRLDFKVQLIRSGARYWKLKGEAWVGDEKAAEAEMTAAIDVDGTV